MSENTSRADGYLLPAAGFPAPEYDEILDSIFQRHVVGVTGLPLDRVRLRWHNPPEDWPASETDWCEVGVNRITVFEGPSIVHIGSDALSADDGCDAQSWVEDIKLMVSFYGPNANGNTALFLEGCGLAQNGDQLRRQGLDYVSAAPPRAVPYFLNQCWIRHWDVIVSFRRCARRIYPVRNLADAPHILEK